MATRVYGESTATLSCKEQPAAQPHIKPSERKEAKARRFERWYALNAESVRQRIRQYYVENGEAIRQRRQAYRKLHLDEVRRSGADWYARNREEQNRRRKERYEMLKCMRRGDITGFLIHAAMSRIEDKKIIQKAKESRGLMAALDQAYGAGTEERTEVVICSLLTRWRIMLRK